MVQDPPIVEIGLGNNHKALFRNLVLGLMKTHTGKNQSPRSPGLPMNRASGRAPMPGEDT